MMCVPEPDTLRSGLWADWGYCSLLSLPAPAAVVLPETGFPLKEHSKENGHCCGSSVK